MTRSDASGNEKVREKIAEVHGNRTNVGNPQKTALSQTIGAKSCALVVDDTDLSIVVENWSLLSDQTKEHIVMLATSEKVLGPS